VSAGACLLERHLTYDKHASGPDHAASSDPQEFAEYVRLARLAGQMRGTPGKRVLPVERDVREVSRQSLVLRRDVGVGEAIADSHLTVQRPGSGIPAADVARAIGRRAKSPIRSGTLLQWDMLHDAA
jgi:sialic acid synthase SpsE